MDTNEIIFISFYAVNTALRDILWVSNGRNHPEHLLPSAQRVLAKNLNEPKGVIYQFLNRPGKDLVYQRLANFDKKCFGDEAIYFVEGIFTQIDQANFITEIVNCFVPLLHLLHRLPEMNICSQFQDLQNDLIRTLGQSFNLNVVSHLISLVHNATVIRQPHNLIAFLDSYYENLTFIPSEPIVEEGIALIKKIAAEEDAAELILMQPDISAFRKRLAEYGIEHHVNVLEAVLATYMKAISGK